MVEACMRDEDKVVTISGPAGHWALLVDDKVFTTHKDAKKIFKMAREMGESVEYAGKEISVFWIPDSGWFYLDPAIRRPFLTSLYKSGVDPFNNFTIQETE